MDSNLLKEAIADAKAVRQTALANAKVALEEAFSERYQAMFAEKLKEEAGMEEKAMPEENKSEDINAQEIDELIKELEAEVGGKEGDMPAPDAGAPEMPAAPEAPMAPEAGAGEPLKAGDTVQLVPVAASAPEAPMAPEAPATPPSDVPPTAGETDEEVNLDELLASLQEEINGGETIAEDKKLSTSAIGPGNNKKPSASASSTSDIESSGLKGMKDHGVPGGKVTSKGDDATEVTKCPENFDGNKDGNLAKTPSIKEGMGLKDNGVPGGKKTSKGDDATEVTMSPENFDGNTDGKLATTPAIKEENEALKKQLDEAEEVIKYVKTQLNEVNLLNAKLLYTNKLFKEFTMNNEQKMRIVEMFDLAKNVREVKLTYANIAESLNFGGTEKKKIVNASASVQAITEGLASKPVGSTKPSKEIISESKASGMVSKFQKLAGIKKS